MVYMVHSDKNENAKSKLWRGRGLVLNVELNVFFFQSWCDGNYSEIHGV